MLLAEIRRSQRLIKVKANVSVAVLNQRPAAGVLPLTFDPPAAGCANSELKDKGPKHGFLCLNFIAYRGEVIFLYWFSVLTVARLLTLSFRPWR